MKVFISGRVTGLPYDQVKKKFTTAETVILNAGHEPLNPLDHVPEGTTPRDAMKILLPLLCECDAIYLLHDWEFSEGAQIEAQLARYIGLHIINDTDF